MCAALRLRHKSVSQSVVRSIINSTGHQSSWSFAGLNLSGCRDLLLHRIFIPVCIFRGLIVCLAMTWIADQAVEFNFWNSTYFEHECAPILEKCALFAAFSADKSRANNISFSCLLQNYNGRNKAKNQPLFKWICINYNLNTRKQWIARENRM